MALGCEWAADNGCFGGLNEPAYRRMLERITGQPRLLWVTCPDVVAWARFTRILFDEWEPELSARRLPIAYVLQDGEMSECVPWDKIVAVFIGGTTKFKTGMQSRLLVDEAKARGKLVHMGRVNTVERIKLANTWGCDSVDGTSMSMFGDTYIPKFLGVSKTESLQGKLL